MRLFVLLPLLILAACTDNDGFEIAETPKVADPMLIDVTWDPSSPTASQTATISITVQNQGGLASKATELQVEVLRDPCGAKVVVGTPPRIPVPGLAGQQAILLQTTYDFADTPGTYGVRLRLDPEDLLDESIEGWDGETNNVYDCNQVLDQQGRVTLSAGEGSVVATKPTLPKAGG